MEVNAQTITNCPSEPVIVCPGEKITLYLDKGCGDEIGWSAIGASKQEVSSDGLTATFTVGEVLEGQTMSFGVTVKGCKSSNGTTYIATPECNNKYQVGLGEFGGAANQTIPCGVREVTINVTLPPFATSQSVLQIPSGWTLLSAVRNPNQNNNRNYRLILRTDYNSGGVIKVQASNKCGTKTQEITITRATDFSRTQVSQGGEICLSNGQTKQVSISGFQPDALQTIQWNAGAGLRIQSGQGTREITVIGNPPPNFPGCGNAQICCTLTSKCGEVRQFCTDIRYYNGADPNTAVSNINIPKNWAYECRGVIYETLCNTQPWYITFNTVACASGYSYVIERSIGLNQWVRLNSGTVTGGSIPGRPGPMGSFRVKITPFNACGSMKTATKNFSLGSCKNPCKKGGVEPVRLESDEVEAFDRPTLTPNPNNGSFMLNFTEPTELGEVKLLDLQGKTVRLLNHSQGTASEFSFDAGEIASGLYLLQFTAGGNVHHTKVQIIR